MPKYVTPSGIVISVRLVQLINAQLLMLVRPFGSVTFLI